jgi:Lon protease-like protein
MTADALRGPRQIAMGLLRPGWEKNYHGRPAIEPVVCVGEIISHERLGDGRYNFLLRGYKRATVMREYGDEPYRVGWLEPMLETGAMEIDFTDERRRLEAIFQTPILRMSGLGRKFVELLSGPTPTAQIVDLVAFYFVEDVRLKQSLLGENDVRARVARVVENFESLHSVLQGGACTVEALRNPSMN